MAGFYPDVTGQRFALDIDGTVFKLLDAGKTTLSDAQTASTLISDTDSDSFQVCAIYQSSTSAYFIAIFPELRNLDSYFMAASGRGAASSTLEYSSDTTDGLDGTWSTATTNYAMSTNISPDYRTGITSQPLPGIKALRFKGVANYGGGGTTSSFNIECLHLYGSIVGGQNPDRLRFWDATLDQETAPAYFDFGDNPVGTSKVIQFRVKNNSASKTAGTVSLAKDSASYTEVANGLSFSSDGSNYSTTLSIGDLAPGTISSVLYLKRTFDPAESTSVPKDGRITATAATWS